MALTIYGNGGLAKATIEPDDSSTQTQEIQGDDVVTLGFTLAEHVDLEVNDYIEFEGGIYWLMENIAPEQKSSLEWKYDAKFYGIQSLIKNFLVIKRVDGEDDPVFTLTAPPHEHVAMIVDCMNDGTGSGSDWKVGTVVGTDNIVIDYHGKYCDEALKEIAEKVGAEWWVDGQTINVCRCEHGEAVTLGYNKGLTGISPDRADNVKFYTRLYPVGSSRNIDSEKYGFSRLQLPGGQKYVEVNANRYGRVDHYEADAFAGIYPRRIGEVSSVRSEVKTGEDGKPFTIYYFKDDGLTFDPNDHELSGKVKRVSFQEGSELAGLGAEDNGTYYLEVNYDSVTREFEIITVWPYDDETQLPGGVLVPKAGDRYILWNLRMPDEYYSLAEEELLAAVNRYNDDHALDVTVFKAPTDHVWMEDNNVNLSIGRRVRLESMQYFPGTGYRDSRITRITRKVNLPSSMDIEIGDALSRTAMQRVTDSISDVRGYARSLAESTSLPDIIRTGDTTKETDNNLLSALRTLEQFLRKDRSDRTEHDLGVGGRLRADGGATFGEFLEGARGGRIDSRGNMEMESGVFRSFLQIYELIVNRQRTIEGDVVLTEGDTIEEVIPLGVSDEGNARYTLRLHEEWDGYTTAQYEGNVIRGVYNDITSRLSGASAGSGSSSGEDAGPEDGGTGDSGAAAGGTANADGTWTDADGNTHIHGATYFTSWMKVLEVRPLQNEVDVVLYPDADVPAGRNFAPRGMMRIARWGNAGEREEQKRRQWTLILSSTEGCIKKYFHVTKPIIDKGNEAFVLGTVPEWLTGETSQIRRGDQVLYAQKVVAGAFIRVDYRGNPEAEIVYRGEYDAAATYYDGSAENPETGRWERSCVLYYGCQWLCAKTGTGNPPSWDSTDWELYLGDPRLTLELRADCEAVDATAPEITLEAQATINYQDITSDPKVKWDWTRETVYDGVAQTADDAAWNAAHANCGLSALTLTREDLNYRFGEHPERCSITVTATLIDKSGKPMRMSGKPLSVREGIVVA